MTNFKFLIISSREGKKIEFLATILSTLLMYFPLLVSSTEWDCSATTNTGTFTRSTDCTISGSDHVVVANTLEIVGSNTDMDNLITISAASDKRHFQVRWTHKLILRYIKLTGGKEHTGGSIYLDDFGKLNLYSCILYNNTAKWQAGAIYSYGLANIYYNRRPQMVIQNSYITNNACGTPYIEAGIITTYYGTSNITNTTFESNNNAYVIVQARDGDLVLREVNFIDNARDLRFVDTPTISLINTYFNNPRIRKRGSTSMKTCSSNLCTETPFTGICSAVDNSYAELGVICQYTNPICPQGSFVTSITLATSAPSSEASCQNCDAGKYSNATGAISDASCQNCDAGKYSSAMGATSNATCQDCDAGKYSNATGATSNATC
jgi:hypothetical protein